MIRNVKIITTDIRNPWINLALEEYFLTQPTDTVSLFLWQNRDTVVIGRNQNPWTECNLNLMEEDNIRLARRITGGGAVFHDKGNLNFSFILSRDLYDVKRQCHVIIKALKSLGIEAVMTGRNDMTAGGKKFSGNAFGFRGLNALHHGTLLVDADMEKMGRYLTVSSEKMASKGITSVESRVVNLCDLHAGLTVDRMKNAVVEAFEGEYGRCNERIHLSEGARFTWPKETTFRDIVARNGSWEWCYGETPDFDLTLKNRFSWGGIELFFKLDDGIIKKAEVFSDALCEELISKLPGIFFEERLSGSDLSQKLNNCKNSLNDLIKDGDSKDLVLDDLACWLLSEL